MKKENLIFDTYADFYKYVDNLPKPYVLESDIIILNPENGGTGTKTVNHPNMETHVK